MHFLGILAGAGRSGLRSDGLVRCVLVAGLSAYATTLGSGCGGGPVAAQMAEAPEFELAGTTKCSVRKSQDRPLIIEWPSADRANLEAMIQRGIVAVRYEGCEMELLSQCTAAEGQYDYTPTTQKIDRVRIRDEDELYASVPIGAAKLESTLARAGELEVSMSIVGRYDASHAAQRADQLEGMCSQATHIVTGLTTGAFEFYAGASADVGGGAEVMGLGASARSGAERELLNRDGDSEACEGATTEDERPPPGCRALLRVEVVPLQKGAAPTPEGAAAEAPEPEPTRGQGSNVLEPGPGVVHVHIGTDLAMVQLFQWGTMVPAPDGGFVMQPGGTQLLCRAPCDRVVDARPGQAFFIGGDDVPVSQNFQLYDQEGDITIDVEPGNAGMLTMSTLMSTAGALGVVASIPLFIVGGLSDDSDTQRNVLTLGGVSLGGGAALLGGGIALTYAYGTEIEISPAPPKASE